jgi:uncharacterized protein YecE (DUF72 family)
MEWRIGTMGFAYDDWRGVFFPPGLKPSDRLAFYAKHYNCVELDTTFHAIPPAERFEKWAASVPDDFRFSVKVPKEISHEESAYATAPQRLRSFCELASRMGPKLGVVLLQFPPTLSARYLDSVRRMIDAMPERTPLAVEFRHDSWFASDRLVDLLITRNVALVNAEYEDEPREPIATTGFTYVRLIGKHERYDPLDHERWDPTEQLRWWHGRVAHLAGVREAWVLFNNDYSGFSIASADRLKRIVGQEVEPMHVRQGRLF